MLFFAIFRQRGVRFDLRGSAICTELLLVEAFDENLLRTSTMERKDCPLDAKQGYADMVGVLLLFLLLFVLGKAQDKAAEYLETQVGRVCCFVYRREPGAST